MPWHNVEPAPRAIAYLVAISLIGSGPGSMPLLGAPKRTFSGLVPWLLLLAASGMGVQASNGVRLLCGISTNLLAIALFA